MENIIKLQGPPANSGQQEQDPSSSIPHHKPATAIPPPPSLISNQQRKIETYFHHWMLLEETQQLLKSELVQIDSHLAQEFEHQSEGVKELVSKLSLNSIRLEQREDISFKNESSVSKETADISRGHMNIDHTSLLYSQHHSSSQPLLEIEGVSVPPRSPNRRRNHSGVELLGDSDGVSIPLEFSETESLGLQHERGTEDICKTPEVIKSDSGIDLDTEDMLIDADYTIQPPLHHNQSSSIPTFYFPYGKQTLFMTSKFQSQEFESKIYSIFQGKSLNEKDFIPITITCGLCRYLNKCFFLQAAAGAATIQFQTFQKYWSSISSFQQSVHSLAFSVMKKPENNFLLAADVAIAVEDVIHNHPGLEFLSSLPVFQNRYLETVIARLFYSKQHNWKKEMTFTEFKKIEFYECLLNLEKIEDVNATLDIFSYQHFYVIYCKFWELDKDHDMLINLQSLLKYDKGSMTPSILSRVIAGCGKPSQNGSKSGVMTYEDFIWFILSAEDKTTTQSIEYWFRCLDLDGDGIISLYEIQQFYEDQYDRMLMSRVSDVWKFEDYVCSLMDLVRPKKQNHITLNDLKKSRSAFLFFDMIFDLKKYDSHVRRIDPMFRALDDMYIDNLDGTKTKLEGFQKFAARAYMILAEEESHGGASADSSADYSLEEAGAHMDWEDDLNDDL